MLIWLALFMMLGSVWANYRISRKVDALVKQVVQVTKAQREHNDVAVDSVKAIYARITTLAREVSRQVEAYLQARREVPSLVGDDQPPMGSVNRLQDKIRPLRPVRTEINQPEDPCPS
jgi:hypothetical protein